LDRAHELDIKFTDISEERIKSEIRVAEKVLRERRHERRHENIKLVLIAVAGLVLGMAIMTAIAKLLGR